MSDADGYCPIPTSFNVFRRPPASSSVHEFLIWDFQLLIYWGILVNRNRNRNRIERNALKMTWHCSEIDLILLWNRSERDLKLLWIDPTLKIDQKCSETDLKLLWNCSEIDLKLLWFDANLQIDQKYPKIDLKLLWNCSETVLSQYCSKTALKVTSDCSEIICSVSVIDLLRNF